MISGNVNSRILQVEMDLEKWRKQTPEEKEEFIFTCLCSLVAESQRSKFWDRAFVCLGSIFSSLVVLIPTIVYVTDKLTPAVK